MRVEHREDNGYECSTLSLEDTKTPKPNEAFFVLFEIPNSNALITADRACIQRKEQ